MLASRLPANSENLGDTRMLKPNEYPDYVESVNDIDGSNYFAEKDLS